MYFTKKFGKDSFVTVIEDYDHVKDHTVVEGIIHSKEFSTDDSFRCIFDGINYSTILSKLIYLAGRYCDSYNSDILYSIDEIRDKLKEVKDYKGEECSLIYNILIGFRDMGVDSNSYIQEHMIKGELRSIYRKIYTVDVLANRNSSNDTIWFVKMHLSEVTY